RLPFPQKPVDRLAPLLERSQAAIQLPVVVQIVHYDLEASLDQRLAQQLWRLVTQRHESESRAETPLLLKVRQFLRTRQPGLLLHVVGDNDGEPLAARPAA